MMSATFEDWFRREDYGDREQLARAWQEARAAALKEMIGIIAVLPTRGTMNYRRGYEEGVRDALRTLEAAANSVKDSEGEGQQ